MTAQSSNVRVDVLLVEAGASTDRDLRRRDYVEVQRDNEVVHSARMTDTRPAMSRDLIG